MTTTVTAPGRVNLMGEHTDYNAGLCLPVAIPYATTARATHREDGRLRIVSAQRDDAWEGSLDDAGPGRVTGWAAYAAGTLWALREAGVAVPGMDVALDSTLPLGAGLSSSASLEAATALVACALLGRRDDEALRRSLVAVCRRAESEVVGAPTGGLDQAAVLLARPGHALLLDLEAGTDVDVRFDPASSGLALLVVDTRVAHVLTDGSYGRRRRECVAASEALGVPTLRQADLDAVEALGDDVLRRRARHVVSENLRVPATVAALRRGDWRRVGALFDTSHASLRDDFAVSCPELDLAVTTAVEAGALGARMTGGGFGGSAIALVPQERVAAVRHAVDVAFAHDGHDAPGHLDATPAGS